MRWPKIYVTRLKLAEWTGCVMGLVGAYVLAKHIAISDWGWVGFLVANLCYIYYGIKTRAWGLTLQQSGFMYTSLLGIYHASWW